MLKVAHIQLLPLLTGVQRVSLTEIEFLSKRFDFSVVCKEDGPLAERLREISTPVFYVNSLQREVSIVKDLKSLYKLYVLFRQQKFDVVHTHSSKTGFVGRIAARLAGCRSVIHTVHGFSFPAAKSKIAWTVYFLMERLAKLFTHKLIVMNRDDEKFALKSLGYKRSQVVFQNNGVQPSIFSPPKSEKPSKKTDALKVVMVGRLWEQKDPETLVDAAINVLGHNDKFLFDFIGDGELTESLKCKVEVAKLGEQIRFLGWQNNVADQLPNYDVFVLPSKWEGMPLAILEAMSCGLPVIATNIAGNRDLVDDGTDGFLFEIGDVSALEAHLLKYEQDRKLVHLHSAVAREKIVSRFDIKLRHENMAELYLNMAEKAV